jgi:phosphoglycolate phosphatase
MKRRYELLIFDWDGTLIDSEAKIVSCMQAAMGEVGLPVLEPAVIRNIIGLGMREALSTLFPDEDDTTYQAMVDRYRYHFFTGHSSEPFEGVAETLAEIAGHDYFLAVATGKGRHGLDRALHETGFKQWFHTSRCADETRSKPHPQMLEEILDELGMEPEQALMIGDTEYDLQMAQNAGMASVAVTCGVHDTECLLACDPQICLPSLSGLLPWLNGDG